MTEGWMSHVKGPKIMVDAAKCEYALRAIEKLAAVETHEGFKDMGAGEASLRLAEIGRRAEAMSREFARLQEVQSE